MDNFQAIGQLVIKAQDLLDSIKGGAIRAMQTTFDTLVNTSKTTLDNFITAQYGRVSSVLNDVHGELPHVLLTRNQRLEVVNDSSILGMRTLYCEELTVTKEAIIYAGSGNDTDFTGKGIAADFRANVIGNSYVNSSFTILRVKFRRSANTHPSRLDNFFARGNHQGAMTGAAIVKVISGSLTGWASQISHGNGWETRGAQAKATSRAGNLSGGIGHGSINLGDNSIPNDEGEFLICLYGVVNGVVDFDRWGVFPELDKSWRA
ncbi:hypothetical protein [Moritella sp.]|uniref:hypothetical protein n=1 Tax=Moritella sp. TaxID=78556 RepID=UPI001E033295|nr:hypothetical protein [Moritella sp.]MCJ8350728.1 hypothetical protein [Moritella sp.]NQZ41068.1 hypothetical protein [Moritella sp.]